MKKITVPTGLLAALLLLPLSSLQAAPPPWAGGPNAASTDRSAPSTQRYRHSDERQYRQDYRYNARERQALERHLNQQRANLPPGLQKKLARGGSLPPGWQRKLQSGQRLPDDIYYHASPLPAYDDLRHIHGVSDIIIDNEVIRIIDATQTILDVFRVAN